MESYYNIVGFVGNELVVNWLNTSKDVCTERALDIFKELLQDNDYPVPSKEDLAKQLSCVLDSYLHSEDDCIRVYIGKPSVLGYLFGIRG